VVAALLAGGHQVVALVRPTAAVGALPLGATTLEGDITDAGALDDLLGASDALIHVASLAFGLGELVVDSLERTGARRAVFFSSTAVFTQLPAASKAVRLAAEDRIRSLPGSWTILRPTMIYGDAGDRNLARLIRFVARCPLVPLPGGGRALVQPVHVEDLGSAAAAVLTCAAAERRAYNLPGGEAAPLRDVVRHIGALLGRGVLLVPLPLRMAAAAASLWHALHLPPRVSREQVLRLGEDKAFPFEEARRDFGYAPRGFRVGLAGEVAVLRQSGVL
jgi:uncharacterized protein YbjT (DUF2867 family)